jgi:ATP-dependent 26S proteasome regulatory subunit
MAEAKTSDKTTAKKDEDEQTKRERQSGERVSARQEQAKKDEDERTEKRTAPLRSTTTTLKVHLRDDADSTIDSVSKLIAAQGATVKSKSGRTITLELPPEPERPEPVEPERQPVESQRLRIVEHLQGDPLIESVE